MTSDALAISRQVIAVHSKSFALASRLLPARERNRAVVVYAWCRRADDAVDHAANVQGASAALAQLRQELDAVYADEAMADPVLDAFRHVTRTCRIPRLYPEELLEGLAMDVECTHYEELPALLRYCYRVAGTVGLMMCHVMGLRQEAATRNAVHLGVAMQLTNICRDVAEDWERGRLYLPDDLLGRYGCGELHTQLGGPFPRRARQPVARVIADLLDRADEYYRSGDVGIPALSWRCGLAIRTARRVYAAIGERIRARGCDPLAGRAWVSTGGKLALAGRAVAASAWGAPRMLRRSGARLEPPRREVRAEQVLPLGAGASATNRRSQPTWDDRRDAC
jgi:phytoene synthase